MDGLLNGAVSGLNTHRVGGPKKKKTAGWNHHGQLILCRDACMHAWVPTLVTLGGRPAYVEFMPLRIKQQTVP